MHRVVRLCQSLIEGTHTALNVAGGSVIKETLGSFDVKHEGIVLRRGLQHRLRGCFVAAHQLFSANYAQVGVYRRGGHMYVDCTNTCTLVHTYTRTHVITNTFTEMLRPAVCQGLHAYALSKHI